MKVARWYHNNDIRIEEVPTPAPGPHEMLVKVISCGICGSDVVEWYRLPRAPLVQGHEVGAEVVAVGDSVNTWSPGDWVFIAPKVPCLKCRYCLNGHHPQCSEVRERLPGGFAEYILVPEIIVKNGTYLLPPNVSFDQSTFIEPLACVVRAQRLGDVKNGDLVLVIGCGMSGLLHVQLAGARGSTVMAADINEMKRATASRLGADGVIDAAESIEEQLVALYGRKADVVLLCSSAESAVTQAWRCVDDGGVIILFTVPGPDREVVVPVNDFWTREITIRTSYYCGPSDIAEALRLIESGAVIVDDLITHHFPLGDIARGFQLVADGRESIKVIIHPHQHA